MSGFVNPDGSELVGGQKSGGVGQSLQLDASGNLLVNVAVSGGAGSSVNVSQYAGVTPVLSNADGANGANTPMFTEGLFNGSSIDRAIGYKGVQSTQDWIRYLTLKGQAFSVTTGVATSGATAGVNALSLFNPAASGKTVLVYILKSFSATAGQPQTSLTTADPALGTTLTPLNNMPGASTSSVTSCTTSASVVTLAGNVQDVGSLVANGLYEAFENGRCTVLSPGNGIEHGVYAAATTKYGITIYWVEF